MIKAGLKNPAFLFYHTIYDKRIMSEDNNNKINWWKVALITIAVLGFGIAGFFIGRSRIEKGESEVEVVYIKGETITDTAYIDRPCKEKIDTVNIIKECVACGKFYELFPEKRRDSIIYINRADSVKIINDWATKRSYANTLFDIDTLGKCKYEAEVQFNELQSLKYEFTPTEKQTTIIENKVKRFSPYIGAGISTYPAVGVEVGGFIDDKWGLSLEGDYNIKQTDNIQKWDIGLKVLYKF